MVDAAPALRVKVPCNDARDFEARLAPHIAAKGLKVPSARRRPIGSRLRVALELRNGETLSGEAVVDAHVQLDSRPGLCVRFLAPPTGPEEAVPIEVEPEPADGPPAGPLPDADEPLAGSAEAPDGVDSLTASAEILATANRHASRLMRGVVALALLALVLAGAGYAVGLRLARASSPRALAAARVASADARIAEGRILGKDGALEQLLAAREVRPDDPAVAARLARLAGLLESLGASAIDRGDLAVASVHLAAAALADPTRESIRAKRAFLAAREQADEAAAARTRPRTRQRR